MKIENVALGFNEQVTLSLRSLYRAYGYKQYTMSKFEEYDLYARNKDFLISDQVITFTDTNGKLMALKPDVTLSIVKNGKDAPSGVQKVYYTENVYRVSKDAGFKELMQVGLECFGDIDAYHLAEVLMLAAESLRSIDGDCVLDVSHLGVLSAVMDAIGLPREVQREAVRCIGEKNLHEMTAVCRAASVAQEQIDLLGKLITVSGKPTAALQELNALLDGVIDAAPLAQLARVIDALNAAGYGDMIRIDFSVVDNMRYYNGIVFKGFINGVPFGVLSGGQYDKLMQKMHRKSGAIGFAVYLDQLDRLHDDKPAYDVDTVLLYDATIDAATICKAVQMLTAQGVSVMASTEMPIDVRYKQLAKLTEKGVTVLENDA